MKNEEYEKLISPSPAEFLIWLCEGISVLVWRISNFSPTNFFASALGHGFDPDGSVLPEWELKPDRATIPHSDEIEVKGGGFPVGFDGNLIRSEGITKAQAVAAKQAEKQVEITSEEWEALQNYTPPLLNIQLACKIKRYLGEGKSDYEVALLAGCKQSYARHYRLAFARANKNTI